MTAQEIADKISEWEYEAGESFTDYFMHDTVLDEDWGKWLIKVGHKERGEAILKSVESHKEANQFCCQDQEFLYGIYVHPEFVESLSWKKCISYDVIYDDDLDNEANRDKDRLLWAQFILDPDNLFYLDKFNTFLEDDE